MQTKHVKQLALAISFSGLALTTHAADVNAGKEKAQMCAGCHGTQGVSNNPQWPSLAGQTAVYIAAQLNAFKSGSRDNGSMKGIAGSLNDTDITNLAAYFASLKPKSAGGDTALAKTGKDKVGMCLGCHGNNAQGQAAFPRLAGQHPAYLTKQLSDFKSGQRKGGPMGAMVGSLSEQDMQEIAAYLGSLQ
jgi:cytochrome c553